jgi:hypothetical protein
LLVNFLKKRQQILWCLYSELVHVCGYQVLKNRWF